MAGYGEYDEGGGYAPAGNESYDLPERVRSMLLYVNTMNSVKCTTGYVDTNDPWLTPIVFPSQ